MKFTELELELKTHNYPITLFDETVLEIKGYLPVADKAKLIEFVANSAVDNATGTFNPLRVELFFSLALCKWYADIEFEDEDPANAYDLLETNGILSKIRNAIPRDEIEFLENLTEETIHDVARYNSSAAGIIQSMSNDAESLDATISKMLAEVKDAKGLENLVAIKDIVGKKPIVVKKG